MKKFYWRLVKNNVMNYPWHVECYPWAWGPLSATKRQAVWLWFRTSIWPINRIIASWEHWCHCRKIIRVDCQWCGGSGVDLGESCGQCSGTGLRMAVNRGRVRRRDLPNKMGTVWWV